MTIAFDEVSKSKKKNDARHHVQRLTAHRIIQTVSFFQNRIFRELDDWVLIRDENAAAADACSYLQVAIVSKFSRPWMSLPPIGAWVPVAKNSYPYTELRLAKHHHSHFHPTEWTYAGVDHLAERPAHDPNELAEFVRTFG